LAPELTANSLLSLSKLVHQRSGARIPGHCYSSFRPLGCGHYTSGESTDVLTQLFRLFATILLFA